MHCYWGYKKVWLFSLESERNNSSWLAGNYSEEKEETKEKRRYIGRINQLAALGGQSKKRQKSQKRGEKYFFPLKVKHLFWQFGQRKYLAKLSVAKYLRKRSRKVHHFKFFSHFFFRSGLEEEENRIFLCRKGQFYGFGPVNSRHECLVPNFSVGKVTGTFSWKFMLFLGNKHF